MSLGSRGYTTKKDLQAAIGLPLCHDDSVTGKYYGYVETSMFGTEYKPNGDNLLVLPNERIRKTFATVTLENGIIKKVR